MTKFEDGAAISKLSPSSDFSAVRLSNLPEGSSPETVAAFLLTMDVVISTDNVRVNALPGTSNCTADVTVDDPLFAGTVCSKLPAASSVEAVQITPPISRGSGFHRVDCRKVHCSWHRPVRTAWLTFGTENIARKVQEKFNAGNYKICGETVKANDPTGKGNSWNPVAWTVMLRDLPARATELEIVANIPEFHRPRNIELGGSKDGADINLAVATVKSMLLQFGPLEWWGLSTNFAGKRIKAQARFFDESHAREAASSLDNKALSFSKTARLTVRLATSAKFKVAARVYDALRERIEAQKPAWEGSHLHFVVYPPHLGHRVLKLEGEDSGLVAQAKKTLEGIVSGEVASKGGRGLWSESFTGNGDGYRRIKQLELLHGIVVLRDKRKAQLRLFGPEESCKRAITALETLIQESVSDNHIIGLSPDEFQWACRGGFQALASHLGHNKATFDIVSTPKRILISGSKVDHAAAIAIIARRTVEAPPTPSTAAAAAEQTDCSVCWTEAEDPLRTTCDHVYCAGCFSDFCQAAGLAPTSFRLTCVGAQGTCNRLLPLPELRDLLPSAAFEAVLESSFASHIRRNPAEFRYCPTPDCGHVYRPAPTTTTPSSETTTPPFTCPTCLHQTCTTCHTPSHKGFTCAEQCDLASGGYEALARAKKALGIKDCPGCGTSIEKTEGCNHMTCGGCRTHICWVCLKTFGTAEECYSHLNRVHGGAFERGEFGW